MLESRQNKKLVVIYKVSKGGTALVSCEGKKKCMN